MQLEPWVRSPWLPWPPALTLRLVPQQRTVGVGLGVAAASLGLAKALMRAPGGVPFTPSLGIAGDFFNVFSKPVHFGPLHTAKHGPVYAIRYFTQWIV